MRHFFDLDARPSSCDRRGLEGRMVAKGRGLRARPRVSTRGESRACGYAKWVARWRFWCFPRRCLLALRGEVLFRFLFRFIVDFFCRFFLTPFAVTDGVYSPSPLRGFCVRDGRASGGALAPAVRTSAVSRNAATRRAWRVWRGAEIVGYKEPWNAPLCPRSPRPLLTRSPPASTRSARRSAASSSSFSPTWPSSIGESSISSSGSRRRSRS